MPRTVSYHVNVVSVWTEGPRIDAVEHYGGSIKDEICQSSTFIRTVSYVNSFVRLHKMDHRPPFRITRSPVHLSTTTI